MTISVRYKLSDMKIKTKLACLLAVFVIIGFSSISTANAQSSEAKRLLINGMKSCQAAKVARQTNIETAKVHFRQYLDFLKQASEADETIFTSTEPAVQKVLESCKAVKTDLDRAEALPVFEQGLTACEDARIALESGSYEEARNKYQLFQQYKGGALAITSSVMDVYENSFELRLCEQLGATITETESTYKERLLATSANQDKINDVADILGEALSQCRGSQNIASDKTRFTQQTVTQAEKLLADSLKLKETSQRRSQELRNQKILAGKDDDRIQALFRQVTDCEAAVPLQIADMKAELRRQPLKPGATGTAAKPEQVDTEEKQIVGVAPIYPRSAINRGIEGFAAVKYTVAKSGDVVDIIVIESQPAGIFDRAAINAVERYKYQPRISKGEAVDTPNVEKKLTFKLQ